MRFKRNGIQWKQMPRNHNIVTLNFLRERFAVSQSLVPRSHLQCSFSGSYATPFTNYRSSSCANIYLLSLVHVYILLYLLQGFAVGTKVLLRRGNKWLGPYLIRKVVKRGYLLAKMDGRAIMAVAKRRSLKIFH